jgi:transcription-repair coupling factor (superfamily II helicase)
LLKIGYNRVTTVREHGEFSVKGSLIDLFPMGVNSPYRIDLFDQEIESMRIFDASTQRSIEEVDRIFLLPAREFATDQDSIEIFKTNYLKTFGNSNGFIFDEVSESRLPNGIEFYLSLFFTHTSTLFDYLPFFSKLRTANNKLLPLFNVSKQLVFFKENLMNRQGQSIKIIACLLITRINFIVT